MTESIGCQITCQITAVERAQIDALLARTGQTRSEWLQSLVYAALSETSTNVRNLEERVASLEQTISGLRTLQQQVEHLTQYLTPQSSHESSSAISNDSTPPLGQARGQASSSALSTSPSPSEPSPSTGSPNSVAPPSSTPSIYDVEEDEPDEILYEFLEPESSSPSSFSSSSSSSSIYDEDDEPYEILYEFLEPNDG